MSRSTRLLTLAFLGLGALLGYAAASGRLNPFHNADASPVVTPSLAATDPSCPSCCAGANKSGRKKGSA